MRDFIPWVRLESNQPPDSEEAEEEEMTGLLNRYAARKRKRQENVERRSDAAPHQADGSSRPVTGGISEVQAIIISGSPEKGSNRISGMMPWESRGRPLRLRPHFN